MIPDDAPLRLRIHGRLFVLPPVPGFPSLPWALVLPEIPSAIHLTPEGGERQFAPMTVTDE